MTAPNIPQLQPPCGPQAPAHCPQAVPRLHPPPGVSGPPLPTNMAPIFFGAPVISDIYLSSSFLSAPSSRRRTPGNRDLGSACCHLPWSLAQSTSPQYLNSPYRACLISSNNTIIAKIALNLVVGLVKKFVQVFP